MERAPKLLRLAEVAALFQVHPKTAYHWYRTGRLPAIQSPGGLLRVRAEDVRVLADKTGFTLPSSIGADARILVLLEHANGTARAFARAAKAKKFDVRAFVEPYDALLAVARLAPAALVLDGECAGDALVGIVTALRRNADTKGMRILAFAAAGGPREALRDAGVDELFEPGDAAGVVEAIRR